MQINQAAAILGRKGGSAKSDKKTAAARINGAKARRLQDRPSPSDLAEKLGVSRQRAHQILNKDKHNARAKVRYAIQTGKLIKPDNCSRCSFPPDSLEAHHADYSKPLDVEWLCVPCHKRVHK